MCAYINIMYTCGNIFVTQKANSQYFFHKKYFLLLWLSLNINNDDFRE